MLSLAAASRHARQTNNDRPLSLRVVGRRHNIFFRQHRDDEGGGSECLRKYTESFDWNARWDSKGWQKTNIPCLGLMRLSGRGRHIACLVAGELVGSRSTVASPTCLRLNRWFWNQLPAVSPIIRCPLPLRRNRSIVLCKRGKI